MANRPESAPRRQQSPGQPEPLRQPYLTLVDRNVTRYFTHNFPRGRDQGFHIVLPGMLTHWRQERFLKDRMVPNTPDIEEGSVWVQRDETVTQHRYPLAVKKTLAATVAATALFNVFGNYKWFEQKFDHIIGRHPTTSQAITVYGKPEVHAAPSIGTRVLFSVGETSTRNEKQVARNLVGQIATAMDHGEFPVAGPLTVHSHGSPDFIERGPASLTIDPRTIAQNVAYAKERGDTLAGDIRAAAKQEGVVLPEIQVKPDVKPLTKGELRRMNRLVTKYGFGPISQSFDTVFDAFNADPASLPRPIRDAMTTIIGQRRSADISVPMETITFPQHPGTEQVPVPEKDIPFHIYVMPIPWFRREEREIRPFWDLADIKSLFPNPLWVHLIPEARISENELAKNTVMYTRENQILLREERIPTVLKQTYRDDDNKEQTIRNLFIDHKPTELAIDYVKQFMTTLSYAMGGKIGEYLDTIEWYRNDTAGTNAKQVGLGHDKQEGSGTLGLSVPFLRNAQIAAPPIPTREDFENIDNAVGTFVHELMGHYADLNGQPTRITPCIPPRVKFPHSKKNYFVSNNPWAFTAIDLTDTHPDPRRMKDIDKELDARFDIPLTGSVTHRVTGEDIDMLANASGITFQNGSPTSYGASDPYGLELFAEGARGVGTGLEYPSSDLHLHAPDSGRILSFIGSDALRERVAERLGATLSENRLIWPEDTVARRRDTTQFDLTTIEEDHEMREIAKFARENAQPRPGRMIKVLVSASG